MGVEVTAGGVDCPISDTFWRAVRLKRQGFPILCLRAFHGQRHRAAASEAQRCNAPLRSAIGHGVDELYENRRAAGADGMAQRYCSAIDVDAGLVEAEFADHGER